MLLQDNKNSEELRFIQLKARYRADLQCLPNDVFEDYARAVFAPQSSQRMRYLVQSNYRWLAGQLESWFTTRKVKNAVAQLIRDILGDAPHCRFCGNNMPKALTLSQLEPCSCICVICVTDIKRAFDAQPMTDAEHAACYENPMRIAALAHMAKQKVLLDEVHTDAVRAAADVSVSAAAEESKATAG